MAAVGISSGRLLVAKVQVASMRRCGGIAFANGLGYLDAWGTWDACLRLDGIPFDKLDMSWWHWFSSTNIRTFWDYMRCLWFSGCTAHTWLQRQAPVFIPRSAAADLDSPKEAETVKVLGHAAESLWERRCTVSNLSNLRLRQMKQRPWAVMGGDARDCRCPVRQLKRKRQRPGYRQVGHSWCNTHWSRWYFLHKIK